MEPVGVEKFIVPIFDSNFDCGCGVFVGDYLITSGHVVSKGDVHFNFDGKKLNLDLENVLSMHEIDPHDSEENEMDYAVFHFPGVNSPLTLSKAPTKVGEQLSCYTFIHDSSNADNLHLYKANGVVGRHIYNFFECEMDVILKPGNSGSPIMRGTEVVGILAGNLDGTPLTNIVFQSSSSIILEEL